MVDFFGHFKIKHADLPYIGIYLGLFVILITAGLIFTTLEITILMGLCSLPVLILLLQFHFFRANEVVAERHQQKVQAYFSLYQLIDFRFPLPYMTGWAATPELALCIYDVVKSEKPSQIVELGSGISSLICGYGMEQNAHGSLLSLDHDKRYGQKTKSLLQKHGLSDHTKVVYAPLKQQSFNSQNHLWYDKNAFKPPPSIDLLIVDGPPVQTQPQARYPALNFFYPYLSDYVTVIIHDALRESETNIIEAWLKKYPEFELQKIKSDKGIGILHRGKISLG